MNSDPLNGPLEVGLRALVILSKAFPQAYDLASLVFFDYTLLHSDEFGGPASIHPDVPNHRSEVAIKRELLEYGLRVMLRADLVSVRVEQEGIGYAATDNAPGFVDLLESDYLHDLLSRADWVLEEFGNCTPDELRIQMASLGIATVGQLAEEPSTPSRQGEL